MGVAVFSDRFRAGRGRLRLRLHHNSRLSRIGRALGYEGGFVADAGGAFVWGFGDAGEGDVVGFGGGFGGHGGRIARWGGCFQFGLGFRTCRAQDEALRK